MPREKNLISVIDLAGQLGVYKQTVFKAIKRLGIKTLKRQQPSRRNQRVSFVTIDDQRRLIEVIGSADSQADSSAAFSGSDDLGFFYIIQLEPEHDPGRLKLGFSISVTERLRQHRCSAPFATVIKTWPCRRTWERAAIDCVSANSERLHTEVFRLANIDLAADRAEKFFAIMPIIHDTDGEDEESR